MRGRDALHRAVHHHHDEAMRIGCVDARVHGGAAVSGEICGIGWEGHRDLLQTTLCSKELNGPAGADLRVRKCERGPPRRKSSDK